MRATSPGRLRVVVIGAGPVGLYLAARLGTAGLETILVERRASRPPGSRAIGVHPPGAAALLAVGALDEVRAGAVRLTAARAVGATGPLATLDLSVAGEVLAVPQEVVEAALERRLEGLGCVRLLRGHEFRSMIVRGDGVEVLARAGGGDVVVPADVVVGCDGRGSAVRRALGVGARGGPYGDRYVMADLTRDDDDSDALVVLHRNGVVEGFPLRGRRRWVAHAGSVGDEGDAGDARDPLTRLLSALRERLGLDLPRLPCSPASAFRVERQIAGAFARGRVALAGDAAHVLSPIGGQGMNLGWLDAVELVARLEACRAGDVEAALAAYERRRYPAARRAIRRAALNTRLGRPLSPWAAAVRDALLRRALRPPFARWSLGAFTMRGLV